MTTQFAGETGWDAIVNDNALDIVEEARFEQFVIDNGGDRELPLSELEVLFVEFQAEMGGE